MNDEMLKLAIYCSISKYREAVMNALNECDGIMIPTNIAKATGIRTNHISKVLSELKGKGLIECINEEDRKGRLYRLTVLGKEVAPLIPIVG